MAQPTAPAASDEKVKKHMEKMRQAKDDKPKQRKGCIAKQIQLQQMGEEMHGPRHLAAAIEQNAHLLSSVVTKAAGAATWEADENHMPNSPSKVRKQTMRRPMQQAAHRLTSAKRVTPFTLQQMEHPDTWLHLAIDPREEKSSFYDETMENMVLAAEVPYVVAQPAEHDQLQERVGVCVQLGEKRPESLPGTYRVMPSASPCSSLPEDSFVYVEYLCLSDFDGDCQLPEQRRDGSSASRPMGGPYFGKSTAMAYERYRKLANSFHQRAQAIGLKTNDPLIDDKVSIELGYATMAGGSALQMAAWLKGQAYKLKAWDSAPELDAHAAVAAAIAWDHVTKRFPELAKSMKGEVGVYGIYGTGFSKVTIAYDNPTDAHYDKNFGADVIIAFRTNAQCKGGDHVMVSHDGKTAIVVETSQLGTLISGDGKTQRRSATHQKLNM